MLTVELDANLGLLSCKACDFLADTLRQVFVGLLDEEELVVAYIGRVALEVRRNGFDGLADLGQYCPHLVARLVL